MTTTPRRPLLAALLVPVLVGAAACGSSDGESSPTTDAEEAAGTDAGSAADCPPEEGTAERTTTFDAPPPMCIDTDATYLAEVATSAGDFTITLDASEAPETVNNFVFLARYHFYDGVPFHRIVPGFVIQGGDANGNPAGTGDPGYEFADELPDSAEAYVPGSVAMANSGPDTNGSQFFIVLASGNLDPYYSLFGEVTEGMDTTIQDIAATGTPSGTPTEETVIETVTIVEE